MIRTLWPTLAALLLLASALGCGADVARDSPFDDGSPLSVGATAQLMVVVRLEDAGDGRDLAGALDGVTVRLEGEDRDGEHIEPRVLDGTARDRRGVWTLPDIATTGDRPGYQLVVSHASGAFEAATTAIELDYADRRFVEVELLRRRGVVAGSFERLGRQGGHDSIRVAAHSTDSRAEGDCEPGAALLAQAVTDERGAFELGAAGAGLPRSLGDGWVCLVAVADGFVTHHRAVRLDLTRDERRRLPDRQLVPARPAIVAHGRRRLLDPELRQARPLGDPVVAARLVGVSVEFSTPAEADLLGPGSGARVAATDVRAGEAAAEATLAFRPWEGLPEDEGVAFLGAVGPTGCEAADAPSAALRPWDQLPIDHARTLPMCLTSPGAGDKTIHVRVRDRFGSTTSVALPIRVDEAGFRRFHVEVANGNAVDRQVYTREEALELILDAVDIGGDPNDWCVSVVIDRKAEQACPADPGDSAALECSPFPASGRLRRPLPVPASGDEGDDSGALGVPYRACVYLTDDAGNSSLRELRIRRLTAEIELQVAPIATVQGLPKWRAVDCGLPEDLGQCVRQDPHRVNGPINLDIQVPETEVLAFRVSDDRQHFRAPWLPFPDQSRPFAWAFTGVDGDKELRVSVMDRSGHEASTSLPFFLDTSAPRFPNLAVALCSDARSCQAPQQTAVCQSELADQCAQCQSNPCAVGCIDNSFVQNGVPLVAPGTPLLVYLGVQAREFQAGSDGLCLTARGLGLDLVHRPVCAAGAVVLTVGEDARGAQMVERRLEVQVSDQACNESDRTALLVQVDGVPPAVEHRNEAADPQGLTTVRGSPQIRTQGLAPAPNQAPVAFLSQVSLAVHDVSAEQLEAEVRYRFKFTPPNPGERPCPRDVIGPNERRTAECPRWQRRCVNGDCPARWKTTCGCARPTPDVTQNEIYAWPERIARHVTLDPNIRAASLSADDFRLLSGPELWVMLEDAVGNVSHIKLADGPLHIKLRP